MKKYVKKKEIIGEYFFLIDFINFYFFCHRRCLLPGAEPGSIPSLIFIFSYVVPDVQIS